MTRYLFVTWDGGGNLDPELAVANELQVRGHEVRFLGHSAQEQRIRDAGMVFSTYITAKPFDGREPHSTARMLALVSDRTMGRDVLTSLETAPADVVVVDGLLFGVMQSLRAAGRSWVTFAHAFDSYWRKAARGPLGLALRLRGCPLLSLYDAGSPTLVMALPGLDHGAGDVVHAGPTATGQPATPREKTILVSFSTFGFASLVGLWQRTFDALGGVDARVLATVGPSVPVSRLRIPESVEVHQWLPHAEVLPEASLVISHGGHGTAMAALAHDVPLLILPLDRRSDQPLVGRAIARAGAGLSLSRNSRPARIGAAAEQLLADGPHRAAAARLGAEIREFDGRRRAADILEKERPD